MIKSSAGILLSVLAFAGSTLWAAEDAESPMIVPEISGPWRQVAGDPDLGEWTSPDQQPVDFAVWQAADGTWQLWSCIRKTKCGGSTRLFFRWEGNQLTDADWEPRGIAMVADPALGETLGGLQAPHVIKHDGIYYMFYGDWCNICLATSTDGKEFTRYRNPEGHPQLFSEDTDPEDWTNTRDAMVLKVGDTWYCYYTAFPKRKGAVYCRTSKDLQTWSTSVIVSAAGSSGDNAYSSECPHVVYHEPSAYYYLWRTQRYGQNAQTSVYRSKDPLDFAPGTDNCLVSRMPVAAPEIIQVGDRWYMAALLPSLKGIQIAPMRWADDKNWVRPGQIRGRAVFDFDDPIQREKWQRIEGDIEPIFTTSTRSNFNPPQQHFIGTAESVRLPGRPDDKQTGVIQSPPFTVEANRYFLVVSGGGDREKTYVALVTEEGNEEIARVTGSGNSNHFEPIAVDLSRHHGKTVRVRIVDNATGGWGHINLGGVYSDKR